MYEPKPPNYHRNWKAIDIFIFENGHSYCPPRKYHLVADQLEWWPVTLNYLAKAQYGLIDGNIDLYTLDGHKILTPLELKNETAYVAVIPPDPFVEAEYEKYLVRASKSWEKRQSIREHNNSIANTQNSRTPGAQSEMAKVQKENSEVKFFHANSIQTPEESILIQTVLDDKSADKKNIIVKLTTGNTDKRTNQNNNRILPTIKNNRDKRSSLQASGNKNPGSTSQPVPVKRPYLKKRESIKLSDAKISLPPDIDKINTGLAKHLGSRKELSTEGNLLNKSRIYKSLSNRRNSTQPVLSKVDEVINELKKYSNERDPNLKNVFSLNENEVITVDDKNTVSNIEHNLSTIYIDVTTLKQFKDDLISEKFKETSKTNIDSSNKIFKMESVNESKQDIIQARKEQTESPVFNIESSVEEKTQVKEIVTNTSDNNDSNIVDKGEVITANNTHTNVQNNLKSTSLMDTENAPKKVEVLSVTDKYMNIQDNSSKPNNQIANKPMDVLTYGNKIHDNHSKSGNVIPFQKSVDNGTSEAEKTDLTLINDNVLNVKNNSAKLFCQNITNKSGEVVLSNVSKNQDKNPEPTSEITIEKFIDSINNIKKFTSVVYRVEVEAPYDNHVSVRGSTIAIASDAIANFVDKASNTDEVKILSVNEKTENVNENSSKSTNEGSDRFEKYISTSIGRQDVVNLKLRIDVWNHNNTINSKPSVTSTSHSPYISKQDEFHESIPSESNVINKPSNTTNENYLKDDQKIVVIKYVSRHPKDEKRNSSENSKSNGSNGDFIIIVPILQLEHSAGSCSHCQQKEPIKDGDTKKTQINRVSSIKYPVRRTTSCTSLLNILSRSLLEVREEIRVDAPVNQSKEPSILYRGTNPSRDPNSTYKDENPSRISNSVYTSPYPRESITKRKSVAIHEELIRKESNYSPLETSEDTHKDQLIVVHDKEFEVLEKAANKSIQTEWCNLVMEARLQEDGHYALFLPSIEKLKQYKLHAN